MDETLSFGAYIRKKRMEAGLTQKELARRLFITESSVSKWERDLSYPDHALVPAVCRELGITEHEFFAAEDDEPLRAPGRGRSFWRGAGRALRIFCLAGYAAAAVVCFICNLAVSRGLDWFWIVLASLALSFCFTNLPWMTERGRVTLCLGAASVCLPALLLACWYCAGEWWLLGGAAITAVCLALPWACWAVRRSCGRDFAGRWAALFSGWVFLLLGVIRFFAGGDWFLGLACPIAAFCLGYLWLCLAALRLVRGSAWLKAAALCLLTTFAIPAGCFLSAWLAPGQQGPCWMDYFVWWHILTHSSDPSAWVNLLVFAVMLLCSLAVAVVGLVRTLHPGENSPE